MHLATSLGMGLLFGLGLSLSGMLDPVRVRGFLDVTGAWDPGLMAVLGGAVTVSAIGYQFARRLRSPVLAPGFQIPQNHRIDGRLLAGSSLFGIGWGLSGLCPGPAVAALSTGTLPVAVFVATMLIGMMLHRLVSRPAPTGRDGAAGRT